jgi:two-component system chemotaxis response regulator CheB
MANPEDETEIDNTARDNEAKGGAPSGYSCPECSGVLWEIHDRELVRYRCRVGHAYSENSLLGEQARTMEEALWTAYTALEENAAFSRRLAERARARGRHRAAAEYSAQASATESRAVVVRGVLVSGADPAPVVAEGKR